MKKLGYCETCNNLMPYKVKVVKETIKWKGVDITGKFKHAYCKKCGDEVDSYYVWKYNDKLCNKLYEKATRPKTKLELLEDEYNALANKRKDKIRQTKNGFVRFWKWVWYLITFPFVWLFFNIRDFRSALCVLVSFLLWSASVWVWYLLAIVSGWNTDFAKWCLGIGTTIWAWWLSPFGSPFILLVSITSIGMKALLNLITKGKK